MLRSTLNLDAFRQRFRSFKNNLYTEETNQTLKKINEGKIKLDHQLDQGMNVSRLYRSYDFHFKRNMEQCNSYIEQDQ